MEELDSRPVLTSTIKLSVNLHFEYGNKCFVPFVLNLENSISLRIQYDLANL